MLSRAARTGAISRASNGVSWYTGAYPAASSKALRSRNGTSKCSERWRTSSRLGSDTVCEHYSGQPFRRVSGIDEVTVAGVDVGHTAPDGRLPITGFFGDLPSM
jgi:hypothetical protein